MPSCDRSLRGESLHSLLEIAWSVRALKNELSQREPCCPVDRHRCGLPPGNGFWTHAEKMSQLFVLKCEGFSHPSEALALDWAGVGEGGRHLDFGALDFGERHRFFVRFPLCQRA